MQPRKCEKCESVQYAWFRSTEEYDAWDCPECRKEISNEEDIQIQTKQAGTKGYGANQEEVPSNSKGSTIQVW